MANLLDKLEQLNSECFTYDNYEINWWSMLEMDFEMSLDNATVMRAVERYAVGYCESDKVSIRPEPDSYAVMFEKDEQRFWFHIQKWEFKEN